MQIDFDKPFPLLAKTTFLTLAIAYLAKKITFKINEEKYFSQEELLQKKNRTHTPKTKAFKNAVSHVEAEQKNNKKANKVFKTFLALGFLGNFLLTLHLINKKRIKKIG